MLYALILEHAESLSAYHAWTGQHVDLLVELVNEGSLYDLWLLCSCGRANW